MSDSPTAPTAEQTTKAEVVKIDCILYGEAFTIQEEHEGGILLGHTTVTIYPKGPVYEAQFSADLNEQVKGRPGLLAVIGVGRQVWPPTCTKQNVDVRGSTAGIPCGIGQFAAAKAVTDLVTDGTISKEVGDQIAGITIQQFHHWELGMEHAEFVLNDQYNCAVDAIKKALAGGGSYEDTKANVDHVHELVSSGVFGNIDPERVPGILKGECNKLSVPQAEPAPGPSREEQQVAADLKELRTLQTAAAKRTLLPWYAKIFS